MGDKILDLDDFVGRAGIKLDGLYKKLVNDILALVHVHIRLGINQL